MPPQRLIQCAGAFIHKRGLLEHLPRDVLRDLHQEFVVRPARFALPVGLFAQRSKAARQRVRADLALRGTLDAARGGQRCFLRDLPLVAAHVAHLAGKRLVQPAQALVLREQLRSVRGFVEEGIADIRVARIEGAHVVRGAFDLFGIKNEHFSTFSIPHAIISFFPNGPIDRRNGFVALTVIVFRACRIAAGIIVIPRLQPLFILRSIHHLLRRYI